MRTLIAFVVLLLSVAATFAAEWEKLATPDDLEKMERMQAQRSRLTEIAGRDLSLIHI